MCADSTIGGRTMASAPYTLRDGRNMAAMPYSNFSRRSFLGIAAALPFALRRAASGLAPSNKIPVGLELYSVRDSLQKDPEGTIRAVAKMGYQDVEFYAPYFEWSEAQAKQMRKLLDDLGLRCYSTHNDEDFFSAQKIDKARDLNKILGAKYLVQAWSDPKTGLDAWKQVADNLNAAREKLSSSGLNVGYHNHDAEWNPVEGKRPIEIIASNTKPSVMLQLDVGTCLEAGVIQWPGSKPTRAVFAPFIARTGRLIQTSATRRCSGKVKPTGKAFSTLPRTTAESSFT